MTRRVAPRYTRRTSARAAPSTRRHSPWAVGQYGSMAGRKYGRTAGRQESRTAVGSRASSAAHCTEHRRTTHHVAHITWHISRGAYHVAHTTWRIPRGAYHVAAALLTSRRSLGSSLPYCHLLPRTVTYPHKHTHTATCRHTAVTCDYIPLHASRSSSGTRPFTMTSSRDETGVP